MMCQPLTSSTHSLETQKPVVPRARFPLRFHLNVQHESSIAGQQAIRINTSPRKPRPFIRVHEIVWVKHAHLTYCYAYQHSKQIFLSSRHTQVLRFIRRARQPDQARQDQGSG